MGEALTWLHLSDLHARSTERTEQKRLWKAIANDLRAYVVNESGSIGAPDIVLVSGDIVQEGQIRNFKIAKEALAEICDAAAVDPERVYFVPGNHDINRDRLPKNPDDLARLRLRAAHADELREAVDRFWESSALQQLERKFAAYIEFTSGYATVTPRPLGSWVTELCINGVSVRLCGLNTVWNGGSATLDAAGVPLVGVFQRESIDGAFAVEDHTNAVNIILQHNSTDYLNVIDGILHEAWLGQRDAIVLAGHVHNAQTAERRSVDGRHLSVIGGALYSGYHGVAPRCYSLGELRLDGRVRQFTIDLRKQGDAGRFGPDTERYRLAPSGRLQFALSESHRVLGDPAPQTNGGRNGLKLISDFVGVRLDGAEYTITFRKKYQNNSDLPCTAVNARLIVNAFPADAAKAREYHHRHPLDLKAAKFHAESEGKSMRRQMIHDHDAHKEVMLIFENSKDGAFPIAPSANREIIYSLTVPKAIWGPYLERNVRIATDRVACGAELPDRTRPTGLGNRGSPHPERLEN